ncbi:hypothetical protein J6590_074966 [Homalodisca vitripennis]|nr:hypothetical protein J6590_074966 [Homalodisca vitripennis]
MVSKKAERTVSQTNEDKQSEILLVDKVSSTHHSFFGVDFFRSLQRITAPGVKNVTASDSSCVGRNVELEDYTQHSSYQISI